MYVKSILFFSFDHANAPEENCIFLESSLDHLHKLGLILQHTSSSQTLFLLVFADQVFQILLGFSQVLALHAFAFISVQESFFAQQCFKLLGNSIECFVYSR